MAAQQAAGTVPGAVEESRPKQWERVDLEGFLAYLPEQRWEPPHQPGRRLHDV